MKTDQSITLATIAKLDEVAERERLIRKIIRFSDPMGGLRKMDSIVFTDKYNALQKLSTQELVECQVKEYCYRSGDFKMSLVFRGSDFLRALSRMSTHDASFMTQFKFKLFSITKL